MVRRTAPWQYLHAIRALDFFLVIFDRGDADAEPVPDVVLEADRWHLKRFCPAERRKIHGRWLTYFLSVDYIIPDVPDGSWVFFRSLYREDYRAMFHAVAGTAHGSAEEKCPVLVEDFRRARKWWRPNLDARKFMLRNWHLRDRIKATCRVERECLFVQACMYAYILSRFSNCRPAVVVFFADMQPIEHLISLHFRKAGVTTVTLQHGLYIDYGDFDTVNKINYLHQPSEYFLSWGRNTSELIRCHNPGAKVVECGKPLIFAAASVDKKLPTPYIAVLLDQKIFHEQNREMLRIVLRYASEEGFAVTVRLHPQLSRSELFEEFPEVSERLAFDDADFIVGHTTTMIYEAIYLGCRAFRYRSAAPAISLPDSCEFSSLDELRSCLVQPQPVGLGERFFCAVGEAALENYRDFFRGLNRETRPTGG